MVMPPALHTSTTPVDRSTKPRARCVDLSIVVRVLSIAAVGCALLAVGVVAYGAIGAALGQRWTGLSPDAPVVPWFLFLAGVCGCPLFALAAAVTAGVQWLIRAVRRR
jgi:hypothetical protein